MNSHQTMKRLLRVAELAEFLGVKPSWIYDRTSQQGPEVIPHLKLGRQLRFDLESEAFQKWIQDHAVTSSNSVAALDSRAS
jgi:predicted DNA-binding transcriptional regulator AlpA